MLEPLSTIVVRVSVQAKEEIASPIVGFMLRNHLGIDFSGTNTARLGNRLPPMMPGDIYTVDFHVDIPELYPGSFSFSPARFPVNRENSLSSARISSSKSKFSW